MSGRASQDRTSFSYKPRLVMVMMRVSRVEPRQHPKRTDSCLGACSFTWKQTRRLLFVVRSRPSRPTQHCKDRRTACCALILEHTSACLLNTSGDQQTHLSTRTGRLRQNRHSGHFAASRWHLGSNHGPQGSLPRPGGRSQLGGTRRRRPNNRRGGRRW